MKTKYLLTGFLLTISFSCISQSKYNFTVGVDSTALRYYIKTKKTYTIIIDTLKIDTNFVEIKSYNTDGYIVKLEAIDWENRALHKFRGWNKYAIFDYNEKGYLISENVNWLWHKGTHGTDTIHKTVTEKWKYVNNLELLVSRETFNSYPPNPLWSEKCKYNYSPDGRKKNEECNVYPEDSDEFMRTTNYIYNQNGLLQEIQYGDGMQIHSKTCFEYEFH